MQRRALRLDPPNTFIASGHTFAREPERGGWIVDADPTLAPLSIAPPAGSSPTSRPTCRWSAAIVASVVLHAAAAAFFLVHGAGEDARIAGGDEQGMLLLGNAPEDAVASGELALDEAIEVTIVPLATARPLQTLEAAAVQPVETIETEAVATAAEVEASERLEPVQEARRAEASPEQVATAVPESAAPLEPVEQVAPVLPADAPPPVLATDTPEIVQDDIAVAPTLSVHPTQIEQVAPVVAAEPERVEREATAELPALETPLPDRAAMEVLAELARAKRPAPPDAPKHAQVEPDRAAAKKPARKAAEKPAKTAEKRAGSAGSNQADARRGRESGDAKGVRTADTGNGKVNAAGNAAVTNYPGTVRREISRAVRRISRRDRAGAERDVHVAFIVTSGGGLGGVSIARSSGSAALDRAAVAAVRRAAPFPPIPQGAGRRSWQFTIPLGLGR